MNQSLSPIDEPACLLGAELPVGTVEAVPDTISAKIDQISQELQKSKAEAETLAG